MNKLNRLLKWLGIILLFLGVFYFGYLVGQTPTEEERQQQTQDRTYANDLYSLVSNYHELYGLCERKYQMGINGDLAGAFQMKGQMTTLEQQIGKIEAKYKITPL